MLALLSLGYAGFLAVLYARQDSLLFRPEKLSATEILVPAQPDVQENVVDVGDAQISVLELKLQNPAGVVFFLHGNVGSLKTWFVNLDFYRQANFDLVMMDYRGFGKSTGSISSESQLHEDVKRVWDSIKDRYAAKVKVIYGRSLGSGLAAALAAQVQPDMTILVSPYSSVTDLMKDLYPLVPGSLLKYPLRTDAVIGHIQSKVWLIHGEQDRFIPPSHSRALLSKSRHSNLILIPGAAHADLQDFEAYGYAVGQLLGQAAATSASPLATRKAQAVDRPARARRPDA